MAQRFSHNALNSFRVCPKQYSFRYVEKISVPKEVSANLFLGNAIHRALEKLYKLAAQGTLISRDDILRFFNQQWEIPDKTKISIVGDYGTVDDFIKRGERILREYYDKFCPFDQGKLLGTELLINFRLANTPFEFTGRIDKLWKREDGVVEVCDYKTGFTLPQGGQDPKFYQQMGLYQLAVQDKFPGFESIELVQHFVDLDEIIRHRMMPDELDAIGEELRVTVISIKEAERLDNFPVNEGGQCHFCNYRALCPAKRHRLQLEKEAETDGQVIPPAQKARELADRFLALDTEIKSLSLEKKALQEEIIQIAAELEVVRLSGNAGSIKISSGTEEKFITRTADAEAFAELSATARRLELENYFELNGRLLMKEVYRKQSLPDEQLKQLQQFVISVESSRLYPTHITLDGKED